MSSVLDFFLEGPWDDAVLSPTLTPQSLPKRSVMLMTSTDIKELVSHCAGFLIEIHRSILIMLS
jgi:hypothetical protein